MITSSSASTPTYGAAKLMQSLIAQSAAAVRKKATQSGSGSQQEAEPEHGAEKFMRALLAQTAEEEKAKAARGNRNQTAAAPAQGAAKLMQTLIAQSAANEKARGSGDAGVNPPVSAMRQISQADESAWNVRPVGANVDTYA